LKSQVETLTVATQDAAEQFVHEKASAAAGEVAHMPPKEIVENVAIDVGVATASSPIPEHFVKAEEAFEVASKVVERAPKKATPKKKPSPVETIAMQVTDIAALSSHADVAIEMETLSSDSEIGIEQGKVEVAEAFVPAAEVEVAQPKKAAPKKSAPKKKAPKANAKMFEGSMPDVSDSTTTIKPIETAAGAAPKEAKPVQSKLNGTKAKDASSTGGAKKLKEAAKKANTMKKKTIVVTGAETTEMPEAPQETVEETKKREPYSNGPAGPDWGNLSESTLKRKTVKELIDYLEMKGVAVADTAGKKINKETLVNLVISS
jgi:hypothetical protein